MKLIFCPSCEDVVRLILGQTRHCQCGKSGGKYLDKINAEIEGQAIPIGMDNHSLSAALKTRPKRGGLGQIFEAFVMPRHCSTVHVREGPCSKCSNGEHRVPINHPENKTDGPGQGYQVYKCDICNEIWGCRYQYDPGTGTDNRWMNFGKDPEKVYRHY